MYIGMCMFVWVWICLHICPAKETFRPPKSYTVAKAHALFTSSLYTCMWWKWHKAGLHCITLQLQLDAIQPKPACFLMTVNGFGTPNGYVIQKFSIYLIQSLNEYSCLSFSLKKSMTGLHTQSLKQIMFFPSTSYVWQLIDSPRK